MIDPRELRIGNFVYGENEVYQIYQILDGLVNLCDKYPKPGIIDGAVDARDIMPITLTSEWLERFGLSNGHFMIKFEDEFDINMLQRGSLFICKKFRLKDMTVHQFQNLYYAMTGRELELKDRQ